MELSSKFGACIIKCMIFPLSSELQYMFDLSNENQLNLNSYVVRITPDLSPFTRKMLFSLNQDKKVKNVFKIDLILDYWVFKLGADIVELEKHLSIEM